MRRVSRREVCVAMFAAAPAFKGLTALADDPKTQLKFGPPFEFGYEALVDRAREMATTGFVPTPLVAAEKIEKIDYDAHGKLRFKPEAALFADGSGTYPATFFHVGRYFQRGVRMHVLRDGLASEIRYSPDLFDMPPDSVARDLPSNIGFAGFRFQESLERDDWRTQDWLAFLGASYWRAIGDDGQYGLSARGVAIDSATPKPEEFPDFREFYLTPSPREGEPSMVLALLDGPSITGAFRFSIRRTKAVTIDVEARLFLRQDVERLGIAPITSMYWYGENTRGLGNDWRPEIHDSDGLAIQTGRDERIWRPLLNPRQPTVSAFIDENPKGFGLIQRDRDFEHYLDGVNYDRRPSLWIEPMGDWGRGSVQLMELRTDDEVHDNIGAFWVPEAPARAGASYTFRYRQYWAAKIPDFPKSIAQCVSTRTGRGGRPGQDHPEDARKFVVDFEGPALAALGKDPVVEAVVETSVGRVDDAFAERVPGTKRWRLLFDLYADATQPSDLRGLLRGSDGPLTETWLYRYDPVPRT